MAPTNSTSLGDRMLLDALNRLVLELQRNNEHQKTQEQHAAQQKVQTDLEQKQQAVHARKTEPFTPPHPSDSVNPPPNLPPPPEPQSYRQRLRANPYHPRNLESTLRDYVPQDQRQQPGGTGQTGVLGTLGVDPSHAKAGDPNSVLTTALLGEHGGPAFIRNATMESFALRRNLNWAHTHVDRAFDPDTGGFADNAAGRVLNAIPGVTSDRVKTLHSALNVAMDHPLATYGAYRAVTGVAHGIGRIGTNMRDWQDQGAQFGLNANNGAGFGAADGQYRFGIHNPLSVTSDATRVGAGFEVERQRLMGRVSGGPMGLQLGGGEGLSKAQAGQTVQELAGQGWGGDQTTTGGGTTTQIAENLVSPLLQHMRGLQPADVTQFDPVLRNGGTSIQQLSDSLRNLDSAALATHETVGQAAGSLKLLQESMHGMGSQQGALDIGKGFTASTGMDPQVAGQMAHNPIMQSMMLQQGVLPSGMADANPGTFNTAAMSTLQRLQHATQGFNRDIYNAQGIKTMSGTQAQTDQMALVSGLDPNVVKRYMDNSDRIQARSTVATAVGGTEGSTGIYDLLNRHQGQKAEEQYWTKNVAPGLKQAGLSASQIKDLNSTHDIHKRAEMLTGDLNKASLKDKGANVATGPNATTVNVKFTGAAAKLFQVDGVSAAKAASNAGQGAQYNTILNSVMGDPNKNAALQHLAETL